MAVGIGVGIRVAATLVGMGVAIVAVDLKSCTGVRVGVAGVRVGVSVSGARPAIPPTMPDTKSVWINHAAKMMAAPASTNLGQIGLG